jgi:hypothetical protein
MILLKSFSLFILLFFSSLLGNCDQIHLFKMIESPEKLTLEIMHDILKKENIELEVHSIRPLSSSSSKSKWSYEIDQVWMIQFYDQKMEMERDSALLDLIFKKVPIATPHIEFVGEKYCFIIYRKLPGIPLREVGFEHFTKEEKSHLAQSLATFLVSLQSLLPSKQAQAVLESSQYLGGIFPRVPSPELLNQKLQLLLPEKDADLIPLWKSVYHNYLQIISDPKFIGLTHNDLHFRNLLVDPATKKLTGIVDFSDANWGHFYREFRHFYSLSPQFMEEVASLYARIQNLDENGIIKYAYVFRFYRDFTNLWKSYEYPHIASSEDLMSANVLRSFLRSPDFKRLFSE